ncbi:MAG: polysaccharide biosynthesis C-terminal domain-containing protein [Flavobacteriales bacterium]|jgi:O-antigen/teichoic acid export membrane protein
MGIITRQAIQSTIYSYAGAFLGFLTVWFMNRLWLTPEQNGLLNVIISISLVTSSLSNLGFGGVTMRMFPQFRDPQTRHGGFLFYPLLFTAIGSLLFVGAFILFKDAYITRNATNASLLNEHIYFLLPLTFFLGIFNVLDVFARSIYVSTAGIIVKEIALRVVILAAAMGYHFGYLSFDTFVLLYFSSFCAIAIAMVVILYRKGEWHWRIPQAKLSLEKRREMRNVALFSVITGLSGMLISTIDKIIVNDMLGLAAAGVFSVATYFGSMIQIPARSVMRISSTIIAESWKTHDMENIAQVYRKSALNQFIIGLFLLLGLWVTMDALLSLMPTEYSAARNVILFMGLGYLIDLATGANGIIIATSKFYRYDTWFMLVLVVFTFVTNIALIPIYGITGAGIASCLTFALFNSARLIFIYMKFGIQPFTPAFLKIAAIGTFSAGVAYWIPPINNGYGDILLRGGAFSLVFGALVLWTGVSPDINAVLRKLQKR